MNRLRLGALIAVYLAAICMANLLAYAYGPSVVVWVAFLFVGPDLLIRDLLHERWKDRLWARMGALIVAGSLLTCLLNLPASRVALASTLAFGSAALMDTACYQLLLRKKWMVRSNGSNVVGAIVDSLVFSPVAFGVIMPEVILGQVAAKILGGFIWSYVLGKGKEHGPNEMQLLR
jgi:queuosine precursor transporter